MDKAEPSWCIVWIPGDAQDPRMTSGIASEGLALVMANAYRQVGHEVLIVIEASDIREIARRQREALEAMPYDQAIATISGRSPEAQDGSHPDDRT